MKFITYLDDNRDTGNSAYVVTESTHPHEATKVAVAEFLKLTYQESSPTLKNINDHYHQLIFGPGPVVMINTVELRGQIAELVPSVELNELVRIDTFDYDRFTDVIERYHIGTEFVTW